MRLVLPVLIAAALPSAVLAQDSAIVVRGKVLNAESREGVGGAMLISIACGDQARPDTAIFRTDHDGSFLLGPLQKGLQCLTVRSLGYKPHRDTLDAEVMPEELAEILMVPDSAGSRSLMFAPSGEMRSLETMPRAALLGALVLAACSEAPVTPPPPPPFPASLPLSISVAPTGITVAIGDSVQMHADSPPSTGETAYSWSSGNTQIATVSLDGVVRGVSAGPVAITACGKVRTSVCGSASLTIR